MADKCSSGIATAWEADGNWYCSPVKAIQYQNVGVPGSYSQVTGMIGNGKCSFLEKSFSGPLSPFDEEVSLHFRGPLHLVQFAAYQLSGPPKSALRKGDPHHHRHRHINKQRAEPEPEAKFVHHISEPGLEHGKCKVYAAVVEKDIVHATIDGTLVSWVNNWFSSDSTPRPTPIVTASRTHALPQVTTAVNSFSNVYNDPDNYVRTGYYNAKSQHLEGLTFLGSKGGAGSGVFDYAYGASISYISADATACAASPQILGDAVIASNVEFTIMTDKVCNGDCGFVRPGSVAYHGFEGADKVFLMEFQMPLDGNRGFNGDMPAIWMLNAQISRTMQYGDPSCNCWASGCGEFDIVEVLSSGAIQCKSTIRTNEVAGDSDYIIRPITETMKLAVIFDSASSIAQVQVLNEHTQFGPQMTTAQVQSLMILSSENETSVFHCS